MSMIISIVQFILVTAHLHKNAVLIIAKMLIVFFTSQIAPMYTSTLVRFPAPQMQFSIIALVGLLRTFRNFFPT